MVRADCRHFKGEKPCKYKLSCEDCPHFEPFSERILIIKGRAQGDVLRTTALLPGLRRKYPKSFISWLVDKESEELLFNNPYIDRIFTFNLEGVLPLLVEKFDVLVSLDKEPLSTSLAARIKSTKKLGFGMNEFGSLAIFNKASEYAYRLGIDDELKFYQNKKTYQEIIYEMAEIGYESDEYVFQLKEEAKKKVKNFFKTNRIPKSRLAVGLNTGSGSKFETKQWPKQNFLKLIDCLSTELRASVFLLGGPREQELNRYLEKKSTDTVYNTGSDNSLLEFAGFISLMDVIVCSDTLAMHLAIALKRKVVALFGPTCPQEVDLYGRGAKIFRAVSCSPCYKQTCNSEECMKEISAEEVLKEIKKII